jgi:hypothetical protein
MLLLLLLLLLLLDVDVPPIVTLPMAASTNKLSGRPLVAATAADKRVAAPNDEKGDRPLFPFGNNVGDRPLLPISSKLWLRALPLLVSYEGGPNDREIMLKSTVVECCSWSQTAVK